MQFRATVNGDSVIVAAALGAGRVVIADMTRQVLLWDVRDVDGPSALEFSCNGEKLFLGSWDTPTVEVLCWRNRERTQLDAPKGVSRILSDDDGSFIVLQARRGRQDIIDLASGARTQLKHAHFVSEGFYRSDKNEFWAPSQSKGCVVVISLNPIVSEIRQVTDKTIYSIALEPNRRSFAVSDASDLIQLRDIESGELKWGWRSPKGADVGVCAFSRDFRYLALRSVNGGCTFVLDPESGALLRRLDFLLDDPTIGSKFLLGEGRILDAETGETSDGVSKVAWWRAIGA